MGVFGTCVMSRPSGSWMRSNATGGASTTNRRAGASSPTGRWSNGWAQQEHLTHVGGQFVSHALDSAGAHASGSTISAAPLASRTSKTKSTAKTGRLTNFRYTTTG